MPTRILLVEDDPLIVESLTELLAGEGYAVDAADTQDRAIARAVPAAGYTSGTATGGTVAATGSATIGAYTSPSQHSPYQLVLLDVTLAQGNGFAVCAAIKQAAPDLPVIFLTASDDEFNTVTGLTMGADDYIAKPFRPRELLARVAATIRRSQPRQRVVTLGPVRIDTERAHAEKNGREIVLSALEYRLLLLFATNAGKLVTRDMIRDALWDDAGTYIEENTLSVYIKRLRDKIEDDPGAPQLILTVRGMGYKAVG